MTRDELCPYGAIFLETDNYILSRYNDTEQDLYYEAWNETFASSQVLTDLNFKQNSWENTLYDTNKLQLKITDKHINEYIGEVVLMRLDEEIPELGIQLLKKYQGQRVGTRIINLFVERLKEVLEVENFAVRIRSDNFVSQRMFEKIGAIRCGEEGKEYAQLMRKFMQEMGKEKFEEVINEDFESTQVYTICYKLPAVKNP